MSFSMLPPELRAIIWEFALPKPRSHIVKSNQMTTKKKKIPVLFQINHESREFVLKHMQLLFEGTNLAGCEDFHFIYFNPKIDTLCLYDMDVNFKFFIGPRKFSQRGEPHPDTWEVAPIKECDMVKSLEIKKGRKATHSLLSKTGYFRNLERLVVRFQKSFGESLYPPFYSSPAHRANTIIFWMTSWAMFYYRFFSLQVTRGKIAAIPDIVFIITKADARFILSTGVSTLEFSGTRTVMNKAVENRLNK
ncbi:uncharacterized protein EAE98_011529 [Botrytis deweyae]|uniref:2EXR domain-containing protein n=1 Tax=Botrytis deweyae TaxID=2478750 RepID=A0ABQ7I5M5_9HELO|nr:uncharacterized protein EAE98_011529 [Botrytis deweyae]KAF7913504.1 hypothetical protein EAE98_011529 [Botrytis deweyae]